MPLTKLARGEEIRMGTRKYRSLRVLLIAVLLGFALGGAGVLAQSPITLSEMSVALWPEYDKAGVLVIYSGMLSPDARLPVDIAFAIPASVGKPSATAGIDEQGSFRYRQYEAVVQGDTLLVRYNLPYRRFQFEYYYDPLNGQEADRQFDFSYQADYAVDSFTWEVQEPSGSVDFRTSPPADSRTFEAQLPLNVIEMGSLAAGATAGVTVGYRKESAALSVEALGLPTPSSVEFEDAPRQQTGSRSLLIIGISTAIVIGVVLALVWWLRVQSKTPMNRQARRAAARKAGSQPAGGPARSPAPRRMSERVDTASVTGYCHQCGRALKADERFCPGCGVARKS
jgi:hypothetical protein